MLGLGLINFCAPVWPPLSRVFLIGVFLVGGVSLLVMAAGGMGSVDFVGSGDLSIGALIGALTTGMSEGGVGVCIGVDGAADMGLDRGTIFSTLGSSAMDFFASLSSINSASIGLLSSTITG